MSQPCHKVVFITGTSLKVVVRGWNWWAYLAHTHDSVNGINTRPIMILDNPHSTVRQLTSLPDILIGSAHTLLSTKLGIFQVCAQWIPCLLSSWQKNPICVEVCQYLIEQLANYTDCLNNVITANEMWIYYYHSSFKQ